jgi:uncharacterized protein YndB with AHSA1/START domain
MWTDPQHVAKWWGPNGFTNTIHEMDVRPGGVWRFVMHGPDGRDYPNKSVYVEIVKPHRIVYDHVSGPAFRMTATFDDQNGKTKLTVRMLFETPELRDKTAREFGAVEGLNQTLGRLAEQLGQSASASPPFVISRTFDAPRDLVWKAWTERDRLMQWFGPKGSTMRHATMDFRPGGVFHYCLRSPDGNDMWGKFVYREIVPPERIVWMHSFSDEQGGLTRHPFSSGWPLEMLTTVTFAEHEGKTKVTVRWVPINPTAAERETFQNNREGMKMGWTGTFDQLTEYLAKS